jgi:hypothetical protein
MVLASRKFGITKALNNNYFSSETSKRARMPSISKKEE